MVQFNSNSTYTVPFSSGAGERKLQTLQVIPSLHHVSFSQFQDLFFISSLAIPGPEVYSESQLFHYCNVTQALNSVEIPAVYSVRIPAVSI